MNLIESRAAELRDTFIENAIQFGLTQDEIDAATSYDDGCDTFYLEAEAEARKALAASRGTHRRAIRAATPRKPMTRRAPRRAAQKKVSGSDGDGDVGGAGPWSYQAFDLFASNSLPILSPSMRGHGYGRWTSYRGPTILGPISRITVSELWRGEGKSRSVTLIWSDAENGQNGEGVVALVAHVLKISESDAANRLAHFLSIATNVPLEKFRVGFLPPHARRVA